MSQDTERSGDQNDSHERRAGAARRRRAANGEEASVSLREVCGPSLARQRENWSVTITPVVR